jgi:hypothetical protein
MESGFDFWEGMRFLPKIWIGSGVHSAFSTVGTWGSCPALKRPGREDHYLVLG